MQQYLPGCQDLRVTAV